MDIWIFVRLYFPFYVCPFLYRYTKKAMHFIYLPSPSFCPFRTVYVYMVLFLRVCFQSGNRCREPVVWLGCEMADVIIEDFHTMIVLLFL